MKKTKLIATLLVSSQVLLATPIVLADETATTQSIVPISGTVDSTVATDSSDSTTTTSSSERLQINAVAIGNALTKEQETYTLDKLGIKGETPIYKTSGTDLMSYIPDGGFTKDWAVYSSVRMQTLAEGEGITVDIATPENITRITAAQYQNAALTAGITDAKLTVASAVPIDGSGALAGVYKIVEESGGIINQDRVSVAQNEMDVLSSITEENKDKDGYSDEALNKAQEQAKEELAAKTADGKELTQADIQTTVEKALKDNGLEDVMTSDQVTEITSLMSEMKDKNIFEDFVKELDLTEASKQIQEKSKGLWENIKGFFSGIWDSITGMFSGDSQ
ncbi:DUF1002 domain-containing protein [Enterococcus mundtii]|uniref:DUF1002 domain-containing protein n=1 Tax=Enterococcus mundtii TaxID=53346 RepID=A0A2T5DFS2_ENTMU|nr:DUF1002 domain-containing protein [Enterococcus mundtii]PTO37073.1 DUF1002 domain-containing protein [Enterococcus mundtii]SFL72322.1 Uncharacterized protein YpuA, DUF1002 family [Enterococcus mundtii]STD26664.1 Predicted secreted protein [Enterococcus mundtii]